MEELERDADVAVKLESFVTDNDDPARVQAMLERTISAESQDAVSAILEQVARLTAPEKLLLYLRLPAPRPETPPQADRCGRGEMQRSVAWVRTHLAPQPAVSLPKQHVYREYMAHAARHGMKAVSSADFGKAVKSAFPAVKPRRLGVRGQSRYCYAGVGKATTLATPTLPGEAGCERRRLCKRPSVDAREFIDFSAVAPPPSMAGQSRPGSVAPPSLSNQSRPSSVALPLLASQSRPSSVAPSIASLSRPSSVALSQSRPSSVAPPSLSSQSRPSSVEPRPAVANRGKASAASTNRRQPTQRFVPIGSRDAACATEGVGVAALENVLASPDLDAELLQYFAGPGPEPAAAADDTLWRLRRVLERSLDPPTSAPPPGSHAPSAPTFDFGTPWAPPTRAYATAPPSPVTEPPSWRGYATAPPSPLSGRGYLTAPPSPGPAPSSGRGYATAPPSPGAWPLGAWPAWRSQSVPPEPPPTPVPAAFRDFFGAWDAADGFSGQAIAELGQTFDFVEQPTDINTSSLDMEAQGMYMGAQALDMGAQALDMGHQVIGMGGQGMEMEGQSLEMEGQSIGMSGQVIEIGGQSFDMDGQSITRGGQGLIGSQTMEMGGQSLDMGHQPLDMDMAMGGIQLFGAFTQSLAPRPVFGGNATRGQSQRDGTEYLRSVRH